MALSLFSGAGGMDLGIDQAGFRILACVELDPFCVETLTAWTARRRPRPRIIHADIRSIDPLGLMGELGLEPGQLDLLAGGPPCQPFSQIGKQGGLGDDRGILLFEFARFAEALRPRFIMMEQVKGLLSARDRRGRPGGVFEELLGRLRGLGYEPKWRVLNAADYGVPQARERLFVVASQPPNVFEFPAPTCARHVTVREALAGLGQPPRLNGPIPPDSHVDVTPRGDRWRIHGVPEGGWLSAQEHLPLAQRQGLTRKDTTKFRRLAWDEPSLTLRCGEIFFHPAEDRYLTPRECMRLHGYPDDFPLRGPIRGRSGRVRHLDQYRQIANSVPPSLARRIAEAILEAGSGAASREGRHPSLSPIP